MDTFPPDQPLRELLAYPVPAGDLPALDALREQYLALGAQVVEVLPDIYERQLVLNDLADSWLRAKLLLEVQYQGSLAARARQ